MRSTSILLITVFITVFSLGQTNFLRNLFKRSSYCDGSAFSIFCAPPPEETTPPPPPKSEDTGAGADSAYCSSDSLLAMFCLPAAPPTSPAPPTPAPPAALPEYCYDPAFCTFCGTCETTSVAPTTTVMDTTTTAMETTTAAMETTSTAMETTTTAMETTTTPVETTTTAMETTTTPMETTTTAMETTTTPMETTTTAVETTTEMETTTTVPETTTTVPETTTTMPTTTTEALTTTTAEPTTTIPDQLCPDPSVKARFKRVVDGSATPSCDAPGVVKLYHPDFDVVLCTGLLIDASTVQVPTSCGDIVKMGHIIPKLQFTIGDTSDEQTSLADSTADGSVAGTTLVTLKTPLDVTKCPGLPCIYDAATMEGYIDFTKCTSAGYGTIAEVTGGSKGQYDGLQGYTIDSIDDSSCETPTSLPDGTITSCATASTGSPCTGDGGAPIICEAVTGEMVVIGQTEDFPCGNPSSFSFIDFTKS